MTASLDTNVLLRWLVGDDYTMQQKVDSLIEKNVMYHVADAAIIEASYVMERVMQFPRDLICDHIKIVLAAPNINCNRTLFNKALPLYEKYSSESFTDCCLSVYAQIAEATPLFTFDKNLAKHLPYTELVQ